jgi:hypothetical protein
MGNLKLVFSQPYPLRKLTPEALAVISKIITLRAELFEQTDALEMTLGTPVDDAWLETLVDFDYPDRKLPVTLEEGQRFVAKLMREIGLDND